MRIRERILTVVALTGVLLGTKASADTLRLVSFTSDPQSSLLPGTLTCLDLSSAAGVQSSLSFSTPGAAVLVIRFNAECSVAGPAGNYLGLDIRIATGGGLPTIAPPTDGDNALCSGNGTDSSSDGAVSAMAQAFAVVPAGAHTVQVCVRGVNPIIAPSWRIDDTSLTIESTP